MRSLLLMVCFLSCGMAFGLTKATVKELRGVLAAGQQDRRTDEQVAAQLKEIELTEPLTKEEMASYSEYQPGPQTVVQLHVLMLNSAMLAPPVAELPAATAPDVAAQGAMMKKMVAYITTRYVKMPRLTAEKVMARFQNGPEAFHPGTGQKSQMAISDPGVKPPSPYFRYAGNRTVDVPVQGGVELPGPKTTAEAFAKQNSQVVSDGTGPMLGVILLDASKGRIGWERWQVVGGKVVGVFVYQVSRQQSHYAMNYCCYPVMESIGAPTEGIGAWGVATSYAPFATTAGYHGELFVDPETGVVVRVILKTDLKATDLVTSEETRIDFETVTAGGVEYVVPASEVIRTTVIPFGESFQLPMKQTTLAEIDFGKYR